MANPEHIEILKQGVEAWNKWREKNPEIKPDLSGIVIKEVLAEQKYSSFSLKGDNKIALGVILEEINFSHTNLEWANLIEANLERANLIEANLENANLERANLREADLTGANFIKANLIWVNLTRANLRGASLRGANLVEANLEKANLVVAKLRGAKLRGANLRGAYLSWANLREANLEKANLVEANLEKANLRGAYLIEADFSWASFSGADLSCANLRGANLEGANFGRANINKTDLSYVNMEKARIYSVSYKKEPNCIGVTGYESDTISALFKKIIKDQNFLSEFKIKNPITYWLWKITCNCGRSFSLWAFWSVLLAMSFAYIFTYRLGADHFYIPHIPFNFGTMAYYSVVTFTTLGFGDVIPTTQVAAYWVMAEVILGYIMLGGLISIFANKVARQS